MARGNQREKSREANLKKMAAQVRIFPIHRLLFSGPWLTQLGFFGRL